ncbi:hypothetical protein BH18ACT5_BH18ACT5_05080 [soil metagenome]
MLRNLVDTTGLSVLVVTHNRGLAWNIADRVAVTYLGRIIEVGPNEALLDSPKHPYTRALLSVVPETRGMEQQILSGEIPDPKRIPSGCRFHPRSPVLQSGESDRLGIADHCRGEDPAILGAEATREPACWAVPILA